MKDLKEYIILITGGSRGNGLGILKYVLPYFKKVIVVDKEKNKLKDEINMLEKVNNENFYQKIKFYQCDLEDFHEREKLINDLKKNEKTIHTLVNNAGISLGLKSNSNIEEKLDIWQKTIEINLTAPYHLTTGLSDIIADKVGTIINITSLNSRFAFPGNPSYMASKGGLRQLTLSLSIDLAERGIRVNAIAPGYIKTNMTAQSWNDYEKRKDRQSRTILGRWGEPCDLGGTVCYLASNMSSYITAQEIFVDGGWSSKGL